MMGGRRVDRALEMNEEFYRGVAKVRRGIRMDTEPTVSIGVLFSNGMIKPESVQVSNPAPATNFQPSKVVSYRVRFPGKRWLRVGMVQIHQGWKILCGFSVKRTSFGKRRLASEQAAPIYGRQKAQATAWLDPLAF